MALPNAVSNIRSTPDDQNGNVIVSWTQATHTLPGDTITQNRVEVSLDEGATWVTHYETGVFTARRLWELCPDQQYWLRISAKNSTGWGTATTVVGNPLGYCGGILGMWITSTEDETLNVPWGATENEDQGWVPVANSTLLNRAGQKNYRILFDSIESFQYDFDIAIPPSFRLNSAGDSLTALAAVKMLLTMHHNHDVLLAKDDDGAVHYCKFTVQTPHRLHGNFRRVQGTLVTVDAPTYPFTTAL